jgi:hypothetical protein
MWFYLDISMHLRYIASGSSFVDAAFVHFTLFLLVEIMLVKSEAHGIKVKPVTSLATNVANKRK